MKLIIIVPAFNEDQVIEGTLKAIQKEVASLKPEIIVVDDGSRDKTSLKAKKAGVKVLRHPVNRGLGGAIGTGLEYAKRNGFDAAVTIDADGQHDPQDINIALKPLLENSADVVIGSRFLKKEKEMPLDRQFLLFCSNSLTYLMFGQKTSDSLSGFRAFNKKAINNIQIKTERMEVSNEFFSEIKRLELRLKEIPINVYYTKYSKSKGQTNSNAINIVYKLFLRLFR